MTARLGHLLLLLLFVSFSGCAEDILHDLDELQANQVRVALSKVGIRAWKEQRGSAWSIGVSSSNVDDALSLLAEKRVVRRPKKIAAHGSTSLIQSKEERSHYVEKTLGVGLEQTLERIPGVLEARVHIKLHAKRRYDSKRGSVEGSASVLIIQGQSVTIEVQAVKELVAGATSLLKDSIAVVTVVERAPEMEVREDSPAEPEAWMRRDDYWSFVRDYQLSGLLLCSLLLIFALATVLRRARFRQAQLRGGGDA